MLLTMLASSLMAANASAQRHTYVIVQGEGGTPWDSLRSDERVPEARAGFARERAEAFVAIDRAIQGSWQDVGELQLGRALSRLTHARRLAEANADLLGMHSWLAELEVMTAIVTAQLASTANEWQELIDQSLRRAVSLDGQRRLQAGEAPPQLIARADALRQETRSAAESVLPVRSNVPAEVYLDGQLVGTSPLEVRTRSGRHHVVVTALGHRSVGMLFDFEAGQHADLRVVMPENDEHRRQRALSRVTRPTDSVPLLNEDEELVWIEASARRALVVRCTNHGCGAAERQEEPRLPIASASAEVPVSEDDREWLSSEPPPPPPPPRRWYQRPGVWIGIGTALAVGAAAAARAVDRSPSRTLQTRIDFGDTTP